MIKSEIAKKERFAPIRFAEDFCYIRDCAFYCKKVAVMDEVLYFYRRDNENAMTSHFFSEKYILDYMKLVSAKYSCGFPDPQVLPIIVVDRYLDYFTTIMEDRLWQVLAEPVSRWRNRSGLSMNAARAA